MAQRKRPGRAQQKRKGVVLLIIVTLLTLFIMIGVTLSLLAMNYKHSSEAIRAAGTYGDLPERELDLAFGQLLYGAPNLTAVSPHNLLADLYGSDGVAGTVTSYVEENGGQVIRITGAALPIAQQPFGQSFSPLPHYYAGRVLTFTDGDAAGFSTRVLAYIPAQNLIFVEAIDTDLPVKVLPSNNSRFVINGGPFNGTGFGYDQTTYNIDQVDGNSRLTSLMPNRAAYANPPAQPWDQGGSDEAWDAPDLNNMHLSVVPPGLALDQTLPVVPSLHRPELVNYWLYQINSGGGNINQIPIDLLRQISLRPIGAEYVGGANQTDHPGFTGSNPNYHPINGPWDVDNDGDGIADSIWVDPGLPIVTSRDGRKYKRLVAYLLKDLDGRINVNVHGNLNQITAVNRADQGTPTLGLFPGGMGLKRGSGYGPGEVDFLSVFGNFGTANDLTAYSTLLLQRYGNDGRPGVANVRDGFNIVKHHGTPNSYDANTVMEWASPPDVWGRGALTLDSAGTPITQYMGQLGEMLDNPYEIHVGQHALAADAPYTPGDMEALLRYHDPQAAGLSSRLFNSGTNGVYYLNVSSRGQLGVDHRRREVLTTHSRHIPAPMTRVPREFFADATQQTKPGYNAAVQSIVSKYSPSLLDLYTYKLIREGAVAGPNDPALQQHLYALVPWEIRHGQLFDINRFLGDGFDNNGDFVADDYNESASGTEPAWINNPAVPATFQGATAWHTNDVDMDGDGAYNGNDFILAKQLYARHLFCLAMLLMDDGYDHQTGQEPSLSAADRRELFVRRIAQWAVNVVDFRDSDAVMTAFEYDVNPFNGWQVDGNPGTDGSAANPEFVGGNQVPTNERRLVWGAEFPDLVLTENFAMHDRRTRDTNYDTSTQNRDGGDPHSDQLRIPQGSLFVELYCPRTKFTNNPRLPRELYVEFAPGQWRLAIQKLAPQPSADGVQRPVWRLAISDHTGNNAPPAVVQQTPWDRLDVQLLPESTSFQPENMSMLPPTGPIPQLPIDRYVWFSNVDPPLGTTPEYGRTFVNSLGWDVSIVPGQYALVGPRTATYMGSQDVDMDYTTTIHDGDSPQGILLSQINPPAGGNGVTITDINGMNPGVTAKGAVGIVCDMPPPAAWANQNRRIGLNVTEPLPEIDGFYYTEPPAMFADDAYDDLTAPTQVLIDEPFDQRPGYPLEQWGMLPTGTYEHVRAVFLQRLANPNAAWDPIYNPYITVDWTPVDATVYSGEDYNGVQTPMMNDRDPVDPTPSPNGPLQFGTHQKGRDFGNPVDVNLWTDFWPEPLDTPASGLGTTFFDYDLVDTLAYLNSNLGTPQADNMATVANELGDPSEGPFPWLGHLDRPYTSAMELLMVPAWSQGRLMTEFQPLLVAPGTPRVTGNPYYEPPPTPVLPVFTQLLNFFQTGNPNAAPNKISPQLARILDYVEVPSRYSGTEKWFNPQEFALGTLTAADTFRPPFNKLSRFADPGRININTIYDIWTLEAALGQFPYPGNAAQNQLFAQQLILSRQGYGDPGIPALGMDSRYPTRFSNPFRSADAADMMPNVADMRRLAPAEGTLLRSSYYLNTTSNPAPGPVPPPIPTDTPLFSPPRPNNNYDDPDRNTYFEHQGFQQIGNLFTTQSNVYAVWITVGYFEVEQSPLGVTVAHPDGYRLGQEIGADSGGVARHRAFYIVDRSIPVGYEPGKRHNTDKAVLLKRFIE